MLSSSFYKSQLLILLLSLGAFARVVTAEVSYTPPLGAVTATVNAQADLRMGVPLMPAPVCTGTVSSVSASIVTTAASVPDVTTDAHFIWITSGTLLGNWYQVTGSTANSVTVAEDLQAEGLLATDSFKVIPFWTLNTLFPDGGSIPASSNVFAADALVLLNDVTAVGVNLAPRYSYLYHDGAQGPAGWYQSGNPDAGLKDDVIISPESYITIRNSTQSAVSIQIRGSVAITSVSNDVLQRAAGSQDNQISNPFPVGMTLGNSGLVDDGIITPSPDVFAPIDLLLVFEGTPTGYNPAPSKAFIYHEGSQGAVGWYLSGNPDPGLQDDYEISGAGAIIVRKKAGTDTTITWTPLTPYNL